MKKLLVAYDGGKPGSRAIDVAADLARAFGAEVVLCSVVPSSELGPTPQWDNESVHTRLLGEARDAFAKHEIEVTTVMANGEPAAELSRVAVDNDCDVIVVGAHTTSGASDPKSSVSAQLAMHAPVSTVVIAR